MEEEASGLAVAAVSGVIHLLSAWGLKPNAAAPIDIMEQMRKAKVGYKWG
jgi:hypothetical protein